MVLSKMRKKKVITFNILGCCINRDIFRLNNLEDKYKVNKFIQFVNPYSIVDDHSINLRQEELDIFAWTNFIKRNVCFDFNKQVQEII